jgi:hypothetical protein
MGNYSVEAWVCTAATQPMNVLCKTSNLGAKAEWSHQLRIDGDGRVEHALSLNHGESYLVCRSSARLHPNHWYYLVGTLTIGETDSEMLNLRVCALSSAQARPPRSALCAGEAPPCCACAQARADWNGRVQSSHWSRAPIRPHIRSPLLAARG